MTDADAASRSVGVVVVAAGSGTRLGAGQPKAFVELAGKSMLQHCVDAPLAAGATAIVVVVPGRLVPQARSLLGASYARGAILEVVAGGAERGDSVRAGLAVLDTGCDIILIHDAARCLTPVEVFDRVIAAVVGGAAGAVPGMAVVDTIKSVDGRGVITGTPQRSSLRAVQTPQGFDAGVLRAAYATTEGTGAQATDDAALVEAYGFDVVVVDGDPLAFKITTREDLLRAEQLLREGPR